MIRIDFSNSKMSFADELDKSFERINNDSDYRKDSDLCSEIKEFVIEKDVGNSKVLSLNSITSEKQSDNLKASFDNSPNGNSLPENFHNWSEKERKQWYFRFYKQHSAIFLPDNMIELLVGAHFSGDCNRSPDEKPDWLDIDKFKRGQKFALKNTFGLSYCQLMSLFILFSFEEALKPLIITGKSSTPYTAFKRYLSTGVRLRNWYTEDPWMKGSIAYNDIQTVRKMHANIRQRMELISREEINAAAKIENTLSPTRDLLIEDFEFSCCAPAPGQCPYKLFRDDSELSSLKFLYVNQSEMVITQFGFFGLMILYPKAFGAHNATEENFDDFCHTWRGLGYLLGIDDDFNLCRGSLNDVRKRCMDLLDFWVKPNLREISPECEHMMRCVVEGVQYYFPGSSYESVILYLSELLGLHTLRLQSSLSYSDWAIYYVTKSFFYYWSQIPGLMHLVNKLLDSSVNKALKFDGEKHKKFQKKSDDTLRKVFNH